MIFTRILRNYLLKIGNSFYARIAKNIERAEQFISTPGPLSIGNTAVADKICQGEFFIFGKTPDSTKRMRSTLVAYTLNVITYCIDDASILHFP